jgi:hypothetical protein
MSYTLEIICHDILEQQNSILYKINPFDHNAIYEVLNKNQINLPVLHTVIEELFINAQEHGQNKKIEGFAKIINDFFYFVIKDEGPGIHQTIPNNKSLIDLKDKSSVAITRVAIEEGVTGTGTKGRGVGLFLLQDFIKKNDAEALLISNSGQVLVKRHETVEKSWEKNITGSVIALKVRL